MASKGKRRRRDDTPVQLHIPKRARWHVADEYDDLGNGRIAAELRRQLRGHVDAWVEVASYREAA